MDLNLPAMASTCWVSGEALVEDERVVSLLVRRADDGQVVRFDVRAALEDRVELPGRLACRWVQRFKPRTAADNPERDLKLTAETLFLTLTDPGNELSEADVRLVQFLALMLERKRVIKPRGRSADGTKVSYEHRGTKTMVDVPAGELSPEFFIAVQEQLSILVGGPTEESAAPANETAPKEA